MSLFLLLYLIVYLHVQFQVGEIFLHTTEDSAPFLLSLTVAVEMSVLLMGFPGVSGGKESACHGRRHQFNPWVGKIPRRKEWLPTPVFLPGEFHGWRSLAGYSPWSCKESDTTAQLNHTTKRCVMFFLIRRMWLVFAFLKLVESSLFLQCSEISQRCALACVCFHLFCDLPSPFSLEVCVPQCWNYFVNFLLFSICVLFETSVIWMLDLAGVQPQQDPGEPSGWTASVREDRQTHTHRRWVEEVASFFYF